MLINDKKIFFLPGFQKSGTSTVHAWLNQIDNVCLPEIKETHHFSDKNSYLKGLDLYFENFNITNATTHIGEVDPSYSLEKEYYKRIKSTFPQIPYFIFIIRKPLERAYSHYLMSKLRGYEKLDFNMALNKEKARISEDNSNYSILHHGYYERSSYYKYIEKFKSVFPESNPLFIKFEDLFNENKRQNVFNDIVDYLEIECKTNNLNLDIAKNKASTYKSLFMQKLLYEDFFVKKILKKLLPARSITKIKIYLSKINMKEINDSDKVNPITLVEDKFIHLNNDITEKLEKLINLDLSNWYYDK